MAENLDLRNRTIARIAQITGQLIWLGNKRFAQLLSVRGLTPPQYFTLVSLYHQDRPRSMHVLAEVTHQDAATVTGIIDRLARLGYVSRERGQEDRRKVYVALEQTGRLVVEEIRETVHRNWKHSFATLNQDELEEMLRMLNVVMEAYEAIPTTSEEIV